MDACGVDGNSGSWKHLTMLDLAFRIVHNVWIVGYHVPFVFVLHFAHFSLSANPWIPFTLPLRLSVKYLSTRFVWALSHYYLHVVKFFEVNGNVKEKWQNSFITSITHTMEFIQCRVCTLGCWLCGVLYSVLNTLLLIVVVVTKSIRDRIQHTGYHFTNRVVVVTHCTFTCHIYGSTWAHTDFIFESFH